jgi:hypothetical protein
VVKWSGGPACVCRSPQTSLQTTHAPLFGSVAVAVLTAPTTVFKLWAMTTGRSPGTRYVRVSLREGIPLMRLKLGPCGRCSHDPNLVSFMPTSPSSAVVLSPVVAAVKGAYGPGHDLAKSAWTWVSFCEPSPGLLTGPQESPDRLCG